MVKKYGVDVAKKLPKRIKELKTCNSLNDIPISLPYRRHKLSGDWKEQFAVNITEQYRLIFKQKENNRRFKRNKRNRDNGGVLSIMSKLNRFNEYVIAPGETISELLEVHCMSQLDLADKTGINKKTMNEIIKGKAPITTATALKLEYVFDILASFWNNLESAYREALERKKDMESIKEDEKYLENIPYTEMAKRN